MGGFSGMNSINPASRLVGDWHSVLVSNNKPNGYFRITEELRFFTVSPWEHRPGKTVYPSIRSLGENMTETDFTLRFSGKETTVVYRYFFEGEVLVLSTNGMDGELQWRCSRVTEKELPEYFEREFAKAMEMAWQ
jgi:hypothetical protein